MLLRHEAQNVEPEPGYTAANLALKMKNYDIFRLLIDHFEEDDIRKLIAETDNEKKNGKEKK